MSAPTTPPDKLKELRARVESAATPAERVEATLALAEATWLSDPVTAKPLLEQILAEADAAGRIKEKGRAAYMLGELLRRDGDLDGAARYAETVFKIADATADARMRIRGLNLLGIIHRERSDFRAALGCFSEFLETCRQIEYEQGARIALNEIAGVHGLQGELGEALAYYRQCLSANTKAGDTLGRATSLYNIGWTLAAMGRWTEATESLHRAMAACEEHGFSDPLAAARMALGELSLKRSDYDDAVLMFRAVVEGEREKQHLGRMHREALSNLGWTHFRSGDMAKAEDVLNEVARLTQAAGDRHGIATACCRRAELALARGRLDVAGDLLAQAMHNATDLHLLTEQGEAFRVEALLAAARGDPAKALELFQRSEAELAPLGDTYELALTRLQHGRELLEANRPDEARSKLQAAVQTFRRLAVVAEAEEATRLLYRLELTIDRTAALLQGLLSITALSLLPERFVEQALSMLCDNLRFEQGAVLVGRRSVAQRGTPKLPRPTGLAAPMQTDLALLLPVRQEGREVGHVWLQREAPLATRVDADVLEVVSRTLAPALARLGELGAVEADSGAQIPGLRFRGVIGRDQEVLDVLRLVVRTAAPAVPVLIRGESGSGKELIARALHESGPRADHPFVTVNCAAVPESLLEAEFFGVEPGAATGVAARPGKFEQAGKGTIFLDEIGDMSPALQSKLLRVIEEKTATRVGGTKETPMEARVVAATNMDLAEREHQGLFRRDLLYRLNTVQLVLPPLRRRQEDIPLLTKYFIARAAQEYSRPVRRRASEEVLALFAGFAWPGNIRQLQHVVERAVILANGDVLQVADLPLELRQSGPAPTLPASEVVRAERRKAAAKAERTTLLEALRRANGNVSEAIRLSGFSRTHFYRLLRRHRIKPGSD
jgi:DNA-binding NtrC family response regulator/tetratricopeptide (TPR) repeat protein